MAEEKRQRDAAFNTVEGFANRCLAERSLRPTTVRGYASCWPTGSCRASARCR
jgi:hypothetical protein